MSNIIFKLHLTALLEQLEECENIYVQYNNITLDLPVQQESDKLGSMRGIYVLLFAFYFYSLLAFSLISYNRRLYSD